MRNIAMILLLVGFIVGCSSKPDVGDIESQLRQGWGVCQGLKLTELKKTNGVDRGDSYDMAVSFKLVVTKNATAEEAWYSDAICPMPGMLELLWVYGKADKKFRTPLKVGDVINVNDTFTMVKSEKGWITK